MQVLMLNGKGMQDLMIKGRRAEESVVEWCPLQLSMYSCFAH